MLKTSPKFKHNLARIIPFGVIWVVIGWLTLFTEYAMVAVMDEQEAPASAISLSAEVITFASISVFLIGCLVGALEVTYINKFFIRSSFPKKMLSKLGIYTVLLLILVFVTYMIAASIDLNTSVFSTEVFEKYTTFFFSITNVSTSIQIAFSLGVSLLYYEISDNLGHNVMVNFFIGKYHQPVVENRVFMFTDMKDSTAIAEKLGHITYFEFLRSYYDELSDAIINNYGEVYQYIGDEVVISWKTNGKNAFANGVQCYVDMKKVLASKKEFYMTEYGVCPDFKAGVHYGEVTTGEIGALKKEIFFTGDVLNTTARIQSLCKEYGVDFLSSGRFVKKLPKEFMYKVKALGKTKVKGKEETLALYTIVDATAQG